MSEDIKQCPYCAETIKIDAIVCRFCGRDLVEASAEAEPFTQEKKKGTGKKLLVVIGGGMLLACCGIAALSSTLSNSSSSVSSSVSSESDNEQGSTRPTSTSRPTSTLQPTAPPIEEILETVASMTDAQRNQYNERISGSRVEGWEGVISDVDEGEFFGGFTAFVDMSDDNLGSEVHIDISEDIALTLNKGERIVFSGDINSVSDILGTTIFIENATIESAE